MANGNDPANIPYIIAENGFYYVAYKEKVKVPEVVVSSKGVANGLSEEYNDGWDFGPDSYDPNSTASIPYTQTSGIQEAGDYAAVNNIHKIKLGQGKFVISTRILASSTVDINWSFLEFEGENSITDILSGQSPAFDNMTVIMPDSSFPSSLPHLIQNNYTASGMTFRNITFNLNGLAKNAFGLYGGNPTTTNQPVQISYNFFNLNFYGGSGETSNAYISQMDDSTWNYIIQNCMFSGSQYSVNFSNGGSVQWLINCQDYTKYGVLVAGATQLNVVNGIYQGFNVTGNNTAMYIWGASFSNAYVSTVFNLSGTGTIIIIYSSNIAIPQNGTLFNLSSDLVSITVRDTLFVYYDYTSGVSPGPLFTGTYTPRTLIWENNTYEPTTNNVFPTASDITGYSISYFTLSASSTNPLSLIVITPTPTTPSVPTSATAQENTNPYAVDVYIYGGDVTEIQITRNGTAYTVLSISTAIAMSGQSYKLNPGDSITITYSTAPSWEWLSD